MVAVPRDSGRLSQFDRRPFFVNCYVVTTYGDGGGRDRFDATSCKQTTYINLAKA